MEKVGVSRIFVQEATFLNQDFEFFSKYHNLARTGFQKNQNFKI